ncbi:MAG: NAD-dependent malic enzyme, partial [Candidatus Portnoybacteria bacterium]|nr:NAD-dependent malic enzyme [Candidatus Portnoybacteria bacterium]
TAIVSLAALINACKITKRKISEAKIVLNGAGAAGIAIAKLLLAYGAKNLILIDSVGTIYKGRKGLNSEKEKMAQITNLERLKGGLSEAIEGSDVFIGISVAGALKKEWAAKMAPQSIIFAMANPTPEIMPDEAKKAGAFIIATGRSDFKNQINNVLAFPGIFRGLLDARVKKVTEKMKLAAAQSLADLVKNPNPNKIIPAVFDKRVVKKIAAEIKKYA